MKFPRLIGIAGAVALCVTTVGCSRAFWRNQADMDAYNLLQKKTFDPRWDVPRLTIQPDPRSRFFDPYDPDRPPLPPDDPAAHQYMHWVSGMSGYKSWHEFGDTLSVENPHWLDPFGLTPEIVQASYAEGSPELPAIDDLSLEQALELSYIHSREYQTEIENLYLSALALTFERFQFAVRYLGIGGLEPGTDLEFQAGPEGRTSLEMGSRFGISQLLPTGGQWAIELANNTLWLFSGENQTSTASVLSYSLVQPLLLGAGRKVVLEALTQSERNVLYSARDLARFRQIFFTVTVGGGPSGGFLGLLQQWQFVLNQRDNIRRLETQVERLRALASQQPTEISERLLELPEGLEFPEEVADQIRYDPLQNLLFWSGEMTDEQQEILLGLSDDPDFRTAIVELAQRLDTETVTLDVAQLETRLANSRNSLRTDERQFADSLDQFKIQLGLPPDLQITIDESLLEPFEVIDDRLTALELEVERFVEVRGLLDEETAQPADLQEAVQILFELHDRLGENGVALVRRDFERVREEFLEGPATESAIDDRERLLRDINRDRRLFAGVQEEFESLRTFLRRLSAEVEEPEPDLERIASFIRRIAEAHEELLRITQGLQVIQIGLRTELIRLEPFTLPMEEAVAIGLEQRLDLMNVRAQVMDARRQVEVAANRLEAVLDLRIEGDLATPVGTRPFDFRGSRNRFRAGIGFTAPLDQVAERNAYRAALVEYQRARRDYMDFEDQVKFEIRQSWRQLMVLQQNFETAKQAVRFAALEYDNAVELATGPVEQVGRNQGLNLLNALSSVLTAQNQLIQIWVNYERNRLNIYRDMGMMEIDAQGIWIDDFYQNLTRVRQDPQTSHSEVEPSPDLHQPGLPPLLASGFDGEHGNSAPLGQRIETWDRHEIRPVNHVTNHRPEEDSAGKVAIPALDGSAASGGSGR